MGTDAGTPYNTFGHWVVNELKMYLDAGMTPEQVLNSATTVAAKLLRVDDYVGKVDNKNPFDDFSAFEQAVAVYRKGRRVVNRLDVK